MPSTLPTHPKRAESSLTDDLTAEQLHETLEAAEQGIWIWKPQTHEVFFSKVWKQQLGFEEHEFPNNFQHFEQTVHPDDLPRIFQAIEELKEPSSAFKVNFRMKTKSGEWLWILSHGRVTQRDANKQPTTLTGTHTIIQPYKEIEQALSLEKSMLQTLINNSPDLIWLKDEKGIYLSANSRFEAFYGAKAEEIIGKTDYDFIDRETADFFRYHDTKAMLAGKASMNEETLTFAFDGHSERVETIKTPILDKQGKIFGVLGVARDITERKQHEQELELFAKIFSHTHDGIIICDHENRIININPAFSKISGFSLEEIQGKKPKILASGRQSGQFYQQLWKQLNRDGYWKGEVWNRHKFGSLYASQTTISLIKNAECQITHFIATYSDITLLKENQQHLERIAHFDSLTGLPNRILLLERLNSILLHSKRTHEQVAVCFIDLDEFKPINDKLGHLAGDQVLVEVANRLKLCLREDDTISRIGGDEFILLMQGGRKADVELSLQRILQSLREPLETVHRKHSVSASIGVAISDEFSEEPEQLIRQADQAMYEAKKHGRNRYHFFDHELENYLQSRHHHFNEVRNGLLKDEFELHYQPKICLTTRVIQGFEALIRWRHPQRGLLLPYQFLPQTEGHHISIEIDHWVLRNGFAQCAQWQENQLDFTLSINISATTLLSEDFIDHIQELCQQYPTAKDSIELEVLETSSLADIDQASEVLQQCIELGISIALDDFGTGHSSLTYLRHLPIQQVKIDRSFVMDILSNQDDYALVNSVISLSKSFNMKSVAEGVEELEIACELQALNCDLIQGYGIAKPMPSAEISEWVRKWPEHPFYGALRKPC